MRGRLTSFVALFAVASFVGAAGSPAGGRHDAPPDPRHAHVISIGDRMMVDVPAGFGKYADADRSRPGTQVAVQVLHDLDHDTIQFATAGASIAAGPDGGFTPLETIAAGGRAFLWGAVHGGRARVWSPAFDAAHSLASVDPQLTCGRASASTPVAGPFNATIPPGAQPGGRTVSSAAVAFVFGNPADLRRGVRITTREGVDLGRTTDGANVALGGFGLAGAVFAYGTAFGHPVLWTPELVGRSTDLVRSGFLPCSPGNTTPPPAIAAITPASAARGASVTVSGSGFGGAGLKITVGGVAAAVDSATTTSATFRVPAGAPLGATTVQLTNLSGQSGSIAFAVLFDGNVTTAVDAAQAVTAAIGPLGGSIAAGGATFTVPPGALHDDETITVTPLASLDGSPFAQLLGGFRLEPQGLHFLVPATLTIPLPSGVPPAEVVGFGFDGTGSSLHLIPSELSGNTVVLRISHFSGAGAARLTPSQAAAVLDYQPTPSDELAQQQIAAALVRQAQNGASPDAAIDAALSTWYRTSVKVGLQSVADSLDFYELAAGEWQAWEGDVQFYGRDAQHATENAEAQGLATTDAAHIADLALAACDGSSSDIAPSLTPIIRLASDLNLVPLPIETKRTSDNKQLPSAIELVRACVHVTIENIARPPVFALSPAPNTLKIDLRVDFWTGAVRRDVPVGVNVDDATGGPPVSVGSDTSTTGHVQIVDTSAAPAGTAFLRVIATLARDPNGGDENDFTVPVRRRIDFGADVTVAPGDQASLRVLLAGDGMANAAVTYSLAGTGSLATASGTTDANGAASVAYTASSDPVGGTDIATATFDPGVLVVSDDVKVTVKPLIAVSVSPAAVTLQAGATAQFTATVINGTNNNVTWSAAGGSISQSGLYTAGSTAGTFTVKATSVDDPTKSATASVTVQVAPLATISWDFTSAKGGAGGGFSGSDADTFWNDPASDVPEENDATGGRSFAGNGSATCLGAPASNDATAQYSFAAAPNFAPFTSIDPPGTGATIQEFGVASAGADSPGCSSFADGKVDVIVVFEVSGAVHAHLSFSASANGDAFADNRFADATVELTGRFGVVASIRVHNENDSKNGGGDLLLTPGFYRVELHLSVQANSFFGVSSNAVGATGEATVTLTP